jgi:hypothetical protein
MMSGINAITVAKILHPIWWDVGFLWRPGEIVVSRFRTEISTEMDRIKVIVLLPATS